MAPSEPRRAAVLGSPIAHSLSPVLHQAAYSSLGLPEWTYERFEGTLLGSSPSWRASVRSGWGFRSPCRASKAALRVADEVSARAAAVGAANTLVGKTAGPLTAPWMVRSALRHAGGFSRAVRA